MRSCAPKALVGVRVWVLRAREVLGVSEKRDTGIKEIRVYFTGLRKIPGVFYRGR